MNRIWHSAHRAAGWALLLTLTPLAPRAHAPPALAPAEARKPPEVLPIDLPAALRLAHAQNLDVQIARSSLAEARALREAAIYRFFPWAAPGVAYDRHEGNLQQSTGVISDISKQYYAAGSAVTAQVQVGEALFAALSARQLVRAAQHGVAAQQQDSTLAAAQSYFDLVKAQAQADVARESVRISKDYEAQLHRAVGLGIAFKGDEFRVRVQTDRYQLAQRQAQERAQIAGARLAEVLHLQPGVALAAADAAPVPLHLIPPNRALDSLIAQALASRPELKRSEAVVAAAHEVRSGAVFGPLVPTLGFQGFGGGLGGGVGNDAGHFGGSADALASFSWRIGPGGLFDASRRHLAEARVETARLIGDRLKDQVVRQVIEGNARVLSLADQIATAEQALANAAESLRLTQARKQFDVGDVLENVLSQQELTRVRIDYVEVVGEYDKAQFALRRAIGAPTAPQILDETR